jgi:hypothetical protein
MAGWMHDKLKPLGVQCFIDYLNLPPGDYRPQLLKLIEQAQNFIILLTPGVFDKCGDSEDMLRQELEHAFRHRRTLIPIFMPGYEKGHADVLPAHLQRIKDSQGWSFYREDPDSFFKLLNGKIE